MKVIQELVAYFDRRGSFPVRRSKACSIVGISPPMRRSTCSTSPSRSATCYFL